jgi:hypothetical protein
MIPGIHILIFFLANLAKGNMNFCHHLVFVVCHPFTFHILILSSENPQPNELISFFLTEKKIFLEINQLETRIACGSHVC